MLLPAICKVQKKANRILNPFLQTTKFITFIFLVLCTQVRANEYEQEKITLSLKNATLKQVFTEIENRTTYSFVYTDKILETAKNVEVQVTNASIEHVLNICFKDQLFSYAIIDKIIIIKQKPINSSITSITANFLSVDIKGKITDENGNSLAGANVKIQGTNIITTTNLQGDYSLGSVIENSSLEISFIGYETKIVPINNNTLINISLSVAVHSLDETIVKGYYSTTKRLNTGSVNKIVAEDINKQPVNNPLLALEGRVPGLLITQRSGLPGADLVVRLRGQNSIQSGNNPLFIIDDVPLISTNLNQQGGLIGNIFSTINSNDIESIEVLKDADATAIYGSKGANGVIRITTKKAKSNRTIVDINMNMGWSKVTRSMDLMNTQQYVKMRNEAFANDGMTPDISNAPDLVAWDTTRYTDWKKLLIGGTAESSNGQFRISGGNNNTKFSFGANYFKETTVFPGKVSHKRGAASLSVTHKSLDSKFNADFIINYSLDKNNLPLSDLTSFITIAPNSPKIYNSFGQLNWSEGGIDFGNPFAALLQSYDANTSNLFTNTKFSYKLFQNITLITSLGYNDSRVDEVIQFPMAAQNPSFNPKGSASFNNNAAKTWIIEPQIDFSYPIGKKGKLLMLVGGTWQESIIRGSKLNGSGYTNDALLKSILGAATFSSSNSYSQYKYEAIFGRIGYDWDQKYLINFTARRDGSSRFGPDKRFANFAAIGMGWVFSKENLIERIFPFISYGKLRGSFGITGNDQIGNYIYLDTWTGTQFPYQNQPSLRPTRLLNPDYKWEENRKIEAALETGFLNDKILLNINWFRNRSANQIIRYDVPAQTGFTSIQAKNFPGIVENKGWEFELTTINFKSKNLTWTSSLNVAIIRNKLVEFPGLATSSYSTTYKIGKPLNNLIGYHFLGVNPTTGVYSFEDINNDNQLNSLDFVYLGTTDPNYVGGFENTIQYNHIQISFLFEFRNQKGYEGIYRIFDGVGSQRNVPIDLLNRWQKPGDNMPYQQYTQDFSNPALLESYNVAASDAILKDASFIRMKNLSISYSLIDKWNKRLKITNCRLYIQGQNLFVISKYKGSDPESYQNPSSLPPLKTLVAGIQVTL